MRVLLIPQKNNYPSPAPCLDIIGQGFPYLAGALKAGGHEVSAVNMNYRWCRPSVGVVLEHEIRRAVARFQPQLIGIGGLTADYLFIRDAIMICRNINPDIPIVLGGGIVTYDREFVFRMLAPDFAIVDEAEETIVSLVEALQNGEGFRHIGNLSFWCDGQAVHNEIVSGPKNLNDVPFPDYEPFDIRTYLEYTNQTDNWLYAHTRHRPRIMPISMGRSCPYQCTFCCHTAGPTYHSRSVDNVLKEVAQLHDRYGFNTLFIYDELFSIQREKVLAFCQGLADLKLDVDWTCALRVTDADTDILAEMKRSGCFFVGYGLESASPRVLKSMKKRIAPKEIAQAIERTQQAGIGVQGNFIFGDPAETPQTIAETLEFYRQHCRRHMVSFNYVTPYPGSKIFDVCLERGLIRDRLAYYENIGGIGKRTINMTAMSDEEFISLVDPIVVGGTPDIPVVTVDACVIREVAPCDRKAPRGARRRVHEVTLHCPYCGSRVTYRCLLRRNDKEHDDVEAPAVCAVCHSRLTMRIPAGDIAVSTSTIPELSTQFYGTPRLIGQYKEFNLVAFRNRVYAISILVGTMDLATIDKQKLQELESQQWCLWEPTIKKLRRRIDRLVKKTWWDRLKMRFRKG